MNLVARRFPVLLLRDFRLLLLDRLIAPAAYGFSMVGVSFAVLRLTGSPADLSYVLAALITPALLFSLIGGVAADRFPPQRVIIACNVAIAAGDGTFGLLMLTGHPPLWLMIVLEAVTGTGMAMFYPASQALLPRLVPDPLMQDASAISRLVMNSGQMGGAGLAGLLVAATGPGWALTACAAGMLSTLPVLAALRVSPRPASSAEQAGLIAELRAGWAAFRSRPWIWVTTIQFSVVMMAWYGGFEVLGPVLARDHLGGAAAWGTIMACFSLGMIAGGVFSLRVTPRRPIQFVVLAGGVSAAGPLALALRLPLPAICVISLLLGLLAEAMMVQWTVALARWVPQDMLARVHSYDAVGSLGAMPLGALLAGPLAAIFGAQAVEYGAGAAMIAVSALALIPGDIRAMRTDAPAPEPEPERVRRETAGRVAVSRRDRRGPPGPGGYRRRRAEGRA